ncbi:hypothetical protein KP509_13G068100 [Ceratopteris richardii]|uniref:Exostosin GT47 domain-containing protein n=1 Tax=Ceratopteris richardii TaxID=49495 RepID=A0A8T2TEA5_CERRI|nr:hypothetical protein KP509_13G068100 [Ceratopteris richardii]KAH7421628.1 hypothetical protein KP509_13G068100 [Ceratopteris richardii]
MNIWVSNTPLRSAFLALCLPVLLCAPVFIYVCVLYQYPFGIHLIVKHESVKGHQQKQDLLSAIRPNDNAGCEGGIDNLLHPQTGLKPLDSGSFLGELKEKERCTKDRALVKVFMYEMPSEFHFGMIDPLSIKKGDIWPKNLSNVVRYPGGLYQQHSPEYWLTLDLLNNQEEERDEEVVSKDEQTIYLKEQRNRSSTIEDVQTLSIPNSEERKTCGAVRVRNPKDADVYFVPFFASLSYNKYGKMRMQAKDMELQMKLVRYLMGQRAWKRSSGTDHVIVMHHPNSLAMARELLGMATFIVSDFGRVSPDISHLAKDIVAPYKHMTPSLQEDGSTFESRTVLLFFQGAIHRKEGGFIREKLYNILKDEKAVVFKDDVYSEGSRRSAARGMASSKFCLHLAGDTPSSNRLFDAISSHCIPVIISRDIELPFEDTLDYSKFCLFVNYADASRRGFLIRFLNSIGKDEWTMMWKRIQEVKVHYEYQFPSQGRDATQMVWKSLANKLPSIRQRLHKARRYYRRPN